jgi:hypothetical protein
MKEAAIPQTTLIGKLMTALNHLKNHALTAIFAVSILSSGTAFAAPAAQSDHTWPQSFFVMWLQALVGA